MDDETGGRSNAIARLQELIAGLSSAMVTTVDGNVLRSRPMLLVRVEPNGDLIFLTHLSSHKVEEVAADPRVNVAFVGSKPERYVSVSGRAQVAADDRIRHLWNPTYRAWFPGGIDDPDIAILTVQIDRADYWDVPSSRLVRLWGVAKALATGKPAEAGDRGRIM